MMRFDTIRSNEQRRRMEECHKNGTCYLCERLARSEQIVHATTHWFIMINDIPYPGSVHHYLVVSKRHITKITECLFDEGGDLIIALQWVERNCCMAGHSIFARSGNMQYTHASLDHLHVHVISGVTKDESGNPPEKLKVTLAYKKKSLDT